MCERGYRGVGGGVLLEMLLVNANGNSELLGMDLLGHTSYWTVPPELPRSTVNPVFQLGLFHPQDSE